MSDRLYYFLLGFMIMGLVAMISVTYNPEPETVSVCGKCGSQEWWFQLAEGEQKVFYSTSQYYTFIQRQKRNLLNKRKRKIMNDKQANLFKHTNENEKKIDNKKASEYF